MRAIPHHPLRFALLALLVLQFGALASAQALATLEEANKTVHAIAAALEPAGLGAYPCDDGFETMLSGKLAACAYDFDQALSPAEIRAAVEAALVTVGIDLSVVTWQAPSDHPDQPAATWRVLDGEYRIAPGSLVYIGFYPDDSCVVFADIDPFDFVVSRDLVWTHRIAECVGFDHQDEFGQTPLIYTITAEYLRGLEEVLPFSDPNHRTLAGWTPLMYAARLESPLASTFIAELLEAGADKDARAPDGTSVASLAAANPHLDAATRAALLPPPPIDARSRRIAEDFVRQNDEVSGAMIEYQREIACGLLTDRPTECFVVTRSRPLAMMLDGAMEARVGVVIIATFHDGLDLNDRFGTYRAVQLMEDAPEGRQCVRRFRVPNEANIDWTVRADGTLHLHATSGPLRPHGDDRTPPRGAQALGPLCN